MSSFASSALRLLKRVLGTPIRSVGADAGRATVLDGHSAVAAIESALCDGAGLGAGYPSEVAEIAWRAAQRAHSGNLFGAPSTSVSAEGPRGALAAAMGMAAAGARSTGFLSGSGVAACEDLLRTAAGRRLPMVLHLTNDAVSGSGSSLGSGHEAVHLISESGCFLLIAANVQEAIDFSLIARWASEQMLTPGVVAMDAEQTAFAAQDAILPSGDLIEGWLGGGGDSLPSPSDAQRLLFGETRRRVPRWSDPDRPVMLGALQSPAVAAHASAAARAYLDRSLPDVLDSACRELARRTGREHRRLSAYRTEDAEVILVTQGAAVETAEQVVDQLRKHHRIKAGVLGIRCLRPFPGPALAEALAGSRTVLVLERLDAPVEADPPLSREVRGALARARENARLGMETNPGYPVLREGKEPKLVSVSYGLGGAPVRGADLIRLCREASGLGPRIYLGICFAPPPSEYPKRQVLIDQLRRSAPEIERLGLTSSEPSPDLRPAGTLSLAVNGFSGSGIAGLAEQAGAFLHRVVGGALRSRPALSSEAWGAPVIDRVLVGPQGLRDPGDEFPLDLAFVVADSAARGLAPHRDLASGGSVLALSDLADAELWRRMPRATRESMKGKGQLLFRLPAAACKGFPLHDVVLGAISAVLLDRGALDVTRRRLLAVREEMLGEIPGNDMALRLQAFQAGLEGIQAIELAALARPAAADPKSADDVPSEVRRLGVTDDSYDSLTRFWNQVGMPLRDQSGDALVPDPYLAVGAIPPLSSTFRNLSALRPGFPVLDAERCVGCGACWRDCPDGAIGVKAVTSADIVEGGIERKRLHALRPLASKLAGAVARQCAAPEVEKVSIDGLLQGSLVALRPKLKMAADRLAQVEADLGGLASDYEGLDLAISDTWFREVEKAAPGSGALLALSVDPSACKACGICVQTCEAGALQMQNQTPEVLSAAEAAHAAWERLPETEPAALTRLSQDPRVGSAAALVSAAASHALAGGDGVEPGSGARLALRLTLAAVEVRQAPLVASFVSQVQAARERITSLVRDLLAQALPADDMDALAEGLERVETRQADLSGIIGEVESALESAVDAARLKRLVVLARGLADLEWRLADGRQGLGRTRASLVLSPSAPAAWGGAFPNSPFSVPVTMDPTGDGAQLAAGLLEGQLRQASEGFVLMRKAQLEIERPADAERLWPSLESLSWRDLDPSELDVCPSLWLVGDAAWLGGRGLAQLLWLMNGGLPVKVLALADLDMGLASCADPGLSLSGRDDPVVNLGLLALSQRRACVAQSSLGHPEHLASCLDEALKFQGPALVCVHAPSPREHGYDSAKTLDRARGAVASRTFLLFRYSPTLEGVFGSRLNLEGNPDIGSIWSSTGGDAATPADWALGERRFAHLFAPVAEDAPASLPLAEFLALPAAERKGKTPYVKQGANGGSPRHLGLDPRLVAVCEERMHAWRVLQELAGVVTPFTERVRREAQEQVEAAHKAELESQSASYEQRLREQREGFEEEVRQSLRERLLALAGYRDAESGPDSSAEGRR